MKDKYSGIWDRRGFVLLSGGLDSTTALYHAMQQHDGNVEAVSIYYQQRHHKELEFAGRTCADLGILHSILPLEQLLGGSMLTDNTIKLPNVDYAELPEGVSPTYVPFRNGLMLSMLTAFAQKWILARVMGNDLPRQAVLYFGAHAEDAHNWAYPDCTPEFIGAMANAIYVGSYHAIRLSAPLQSMTKEQIVRLGNSLGVPFANTWSCYAGGELHCGTCPTCRARKTAFAKAGLEDPTTYAA